MTDQYAMRDPVTQYPLSAYIRAHSHYTSTTRTVPGR